MTSALSPPHCRTSMVTSRQDRTPEALLWTTQLVSAKRPGCFGNMLQADQEALGGAPQHPLHCSLCSCNHRNAISAIATIWGYQGGSGDLGLPWGTWGYLGLHHKTSCRQGSGANLDVSNPRLPLITSSASPSDSYEHRSKTRIKQGFDLTNKYEYSLGHGVLDPRSGGHLRSTDLSLCPLALVHGCVPM